MPDETKVKQYFNPNDPVTFLGDDEVVDFDPNRDPYATRPPVADGEYVAELRLSGSQKPQYGDFKDRDGKKRPWVFVPVELHLQAPGSPEDKRVVFDSAGLRDMGNILNAAFDAGITDLGARSLVAKFMNTIQGAPQVRIETQWQARCQECEEAVKDARKKGSKKRYYPLLKGQKNFTKGPEIPCPNGHGEVRAKAVPVRYAAAGGAIAGKSFAATAGAGPDDSPSF
jgi:hypothetical protein